MKRSKGPFLTAAASAVRIVAALGLLAGCAGSPEGSAQPDPGSVSSAMGRTKLIFVSSQRYTADMGGLAGADAHCQALAEGAGHPGQFRAWLSTLSTSATTRLTHATVPYVMRSGTVVANNWTDLTSGTLRSPLDETESDAPPPGSTSACNAEAFWTATDEYGAEYGASDCEGWTEATGAVAPVVEGELGGDPWIWSTFCQGNRCSDESPILCLEQ